MREFWHKNLFYPRLALGNVKKNRSIYYPYLMAVTLMAGLLYSLRSVADMTAASGMKGGDTMYVMLMMCYYICVPVAAVILFYINSFIMKRRKTEFGLYGMLGMGKSHLAFLMLWEVAFSMIASVILGIAGGALLSQFLFLVLLKLVGIPAQLSFRIPLQAVGGTALIFLADYALVLLYDCVAVSRVNPVELMRGGQEGEREPKTRWLTALLGIAALGAGYWIALATRSASDALIAFFPAALLVIVGTFCLFQAGSIAFLKLLRKKKSFYYKPENFVAVSGMIYRMKQNAAGLSSICVLSTAVLVVLSSCFSLYAGEEDSLRTQYPREVNLYAAAGTDTDAVTWEAAGRLAERTGCEIVDEMRFHQLEFSGYAETAGGETQNAVFSANGESAMFDTHTLIYAMPVQDYNRLCDTDEVLQEGEALLYRSDGIRNESIEVEGARYRVSRQLERTDMAELLGFTMPGDVIYLVLPDQAALRSIVEEANRKQAGKLQPSAFQYYLLFDLEGTAQERQAFCTAMEPFFNAEAPGLFRLVDRDVMRRDFYELYGSILFIGIFFVILFLIATVLIIYYKQITEGFDDRERFRIMEKVGMSDREVQKTIRKQVLMVFFLPLLTAVIHILAAFPQLCKLLTAFSMTNIRLFTVFTALAVLVFGAVYLLVYSLTARTYYRIVQADDRFS